MLKTILLVANSPLLLTKVKHTALKYSSDINIYITSKDTCHLFSIPIFLLAINTGNWFVFLKTFRYFQDGLISLDLLLIHVLSKYV